MQVYLTSADLQDTDRTNSIFTTG